MYLSSPEQWKRLLDILMSEKVVGWDTEFTGVDFSNGDSCVNLAKVDLWSIAILTKKWNPRNYHVARGAVLPPEALDYFKPFFESEITKPAHNSNVDVHALWNRGIDAKGVVNTLSMARWIIPGRMTYNLDDLGTEYLGVGKTESFADIFIVPDIQKVNKPKKVKHCLCGIPKCRKRSADHHKWEVLEDNYVDKVVGKKVIPLDSVRPGHDLWDRYVAYALGDALRAVELYDFLTYLGNKVEVSVPWYQCQK